MYWEEVVSDSGMEVWRANVPGGWLVFIARVGEQAGSFFYPDPGHQWDGTTD